MYYPTVKVLSQETVMSQGFDKLKVGDTVLLYQPTILNRFTEHWIWTKVISKNEKDFTVSQVVERPGKQVNKQTSILIQNIIFIGVY